MTVDEWGFAHTTFAKQLRLFREQAELTQRALAEAIGLTQAAVYETEHGKRRVPVLVSMAWAEACGLLPEDAFTRVMGAIRNHD